MENCKIYEKARFKSKAGGRRLETAIKHMIDGVASIEIHEASSDLISALNSSQSMWSQFQAFRGHFLLPLVLACQSHAPWVQYAD